jgi:hypothetical protein
MRLEQSIITGLSELGEVPDYLRSVVSAGVITTVDTQMIIDEDDFHAVEQGKPLPEDAWTPFTPIEESIERTQTTISAEGLSNNNFHSLVRGFGSLLFGMIASPAQQAEVASWHESGLAQFGGFLMADRGGSSIQQWNTVFVKNGEMLDLDVDKVWIIEGHRLDYASVASASTQKLFPTSILIPPEQFGYLRKTKVGDPFLDGTLQLGNISGKVSVPKSNLLTNGGLASTSIFLSKARPRFVRALMAHAQWLDASGRIMLKPAQREGIRALEMIAERYYHSLVKRKSSLPMALAIKFASNRILLDLIATESASDCSVRRDLMAFTRMEGSSYRCLFEIYSKLKVR